MGKTIKYKKSKKETTLEVVKANRKGSREAALEGLTGFTAGDKVFKSKKEYKRKPKHKNRNWEE